MNDAHLTLKDHTRNNTILQPYLPQKPPEPTGMPSCACERFESGLAFSFMGSVVGTFAVSLPSFLSFQGGTTVALD